MGKCLNPSRCDALFAKTQQERMGTKWGQEKISVAQSHYSLLARVVSPPRGRTTMGKRALHFTAVSVIHSVPSPNSSNISYIKSYAHHPLPILQRSEHRRRESPALKLSALPGPRLLLLHGLGSNLPLQTVCIRGGRKEENSLASGWFYHAILLRSSRPQRIGLFLISQLLLGLTT